MPRGFVFPRFELRKHGLLRLRILQCRLSDFTVAAVKSTLCGDARTLCRVDWRICVLTLDVSGQSVICAFLAFPELTAHRK